MTFVRVRKTKSGERKNGEIKYRYRFSVKGIDIRVDELEELKLPLSFQYSPSMKEEDKEKIEETYSHLLFVKEDKPIKNRMDYFLNL